jgi:SSS family solute:Na+ symporter
VLTEDVVNPSRGGRMSQQARLLLTRVLLFVIAGFLVIWGLWYELGQDLWDYMAVSGSIYFTGAFAILLLGLYWKGATAAGAFTALSIGLLAVVGLKPVQELLHIADFLKDNQIKSEHIGLALAAFSLVAMVLVSLVTSNGCRDSQTQQHGE